MKVFTVKYLEPKYYWGQLIGWRNVPLAMDIRAHCIDGARSFWISRNYDTKVVTVREKIS